MWGEEGISGSEPIILNLGYLVYGRDYDVLERIHVVIEDGIVKEVSHGWVDGGIDFRDAVALPGILNSHIHFLDSIVLEACVGYDLPGYVGSRGLKHPLIRLYSRDLDFYKDYIRTNLLYYSGVGDFLELNSLCRVLKEIFNGYGIEYIALSRPHRLDDELEYISVARECGGLGISNPLRIPPWILDTLSKLSRETVVAAHIGETRRMCRCGALEYLLSAGIRLKHVVHGVYMDPWEYDLLVDHDVVLVSCPSSNLWFLGRLPDLYTAWKRGVEITIGTDNTGCFKPDIWREINIVYSLLASREPSIGSRDILSMITRSSIKALGIKDLLWYIEEGVKANIYILDAVAIGLNRSWDKIASIMKRTCIENQIARVTGDKIAYLRRTMDT